MVLIVLFHHPHGTSRPSWRGAPLCPHSLSRPMIPGSVGPPLIPTWSGRSLALFRLGPSGAAVLTALLRVGGENTCMQDIQPHLDLASL